MPCAAHKKNSGQILGDECGSLLQSLTTKQRKPSTLNKTKKNKNIFLSIFVLLNQK